MRRLAVAGLLVAFAVVVACGSDESEPAPEGPVIDRTQPADGDSGVDAQAAIQVWFGGPIDRNRLGDDHLHLVRLGSNMYGKVSYDLDQSILSLKMTAPLAGGEYQAVLKAGVCDLDGKCLKEEVRWSFTVDE